MAIRQNDQEIALYEQRAVHLEDGIQVDETLRLIEGVPVTSSLSTTTIGMLGFLVKRERQKSLDGCSVPSGSPVYHKGCVGRLVK